MQGEEIVEERGGLCLLDLGLQYLGRFRSVLANFSDRTSDGYYFLLDHLLDLLVISRLLVIFQVERLQPSSQ